jgi:23S rRNA pseudouridine1911/1915/1917 synthase
VQNLKITVTESQAAARLDVLLSAFVGSRTAAARLIDAGAVMVNGEPRQKRFAVKAGDEVEYVETEPILSDVLPENIPLDIVFEDDDLLVINKAKGMVVHPAPGHYSGTLVNALLGRGGSSLSRVGGEHRPGIVHRIDKDTSGLIAVAKNDFAHRELSRQLAEHSMARTYECIVIGSFKAASGTINLPIGRSPRDRKKMAVVTDGRAAVTHWETLERFSGYSHLRCQLETGRTHQIRVHLAKRGHAVLGDALYGAEHNKLGLDGQCLHAKTLTFSHPRTGELMTITSDLPAYFTEVLSKLSS